MSLVSQIGDRLVRRVDAVLDAIDAGEDPQPAIARLHDTAPWETAALGLAAAQDAVERIREADNEITAQ